MSQQPISTVLAILVGTIVLAANLFPVQARSADGEKHEKAHSSSLVPEPPPEASQAAAQGKKSFARLAKNDKLAQELGFLSVAEAADSNTALGPPFAIVRLQIDLLRNFQLNTDPTTVVVFGREFIYPITVEGQVRSSLTVTEIRSDSQSDPTWRPTVWGSSHLIRFLDKARKNSGVCSSCFTLAIPELSRYYLGNMVADKFLIIPLHSEPTLNLQEGVPIAAEVVFYKLIRELAPSTSESGNKPELGTSPNSP